MNGNEGLDLPTLAESHPRLRADIGTTSGAAVCALAGDLDLHTRPIAEAALGLVLLTRPPVLCVDMWDVQFCDSSGLTLLLRFRERCMDEGVSFALVAPSPRVARLLELTDTGTLLPVFADSASAVAGLRHPV
ncbi:STAS domain-containing protein [Streptacidiphilus rugosus]|uniref:STAS domain-containing protein n=1 Tax=Streptacidiphilus rugosus TaxID=405783 RepID=UPI00068AB40F|nr:STAS domain-containing protein [Streptacidiphilus rugosus]